MARPWALVCSWREDIGGRGLRNGHHLPHGWRAPQVRNALITQTAHIPPQLRRTLTWDQGRELTLHEDVEH